MKPLETDLERIKKLAAERYDDFEVMRYLLELDDDIIDAELDALVDAVAAPIIKSIDCTLCANCCRRLDVYVTPEDGTQLAEGLMCSVDEVTDDYLDCESAQAVGEWGKLRRKPCVFLNNKLCSVYAHRPESCRTYPVFTPDFRWTLADTIEGAATCPIIYHVLDEMVRRVENPETVIGLFPETP